jgi:LDH2 family malate/lactate/ureidoglycolate dehydrogenase
VLYPGEIEYLREQERRKIGIEIEDATWDKLRSLAAEYKITGELDLA